MPDTIVPDALARRVTAQHLIAETLDSFDGIRSGIFSSTPTDQCVNLAAELLGELEARMERAAR